MARSSSGLVVATLRQLPLCVFAEEQRNDVSTFTVKGLMGLTMTLRHIILRPREPGSNVDLEVCNALSEAPITDRTLVDESAIHLGRRG